MTIILTILLKNTIPGVLIIKHNVFNILRVMFMYINKLCDKNMPLPTYYLIIFILFYTSCNVVFES